MTPDLMPNESTYTDMHIVYCAFVSATVFPQGNVRKLAMTTSDDESPSDETDHRPDHSGETYEKVSFTLRNNHWSHMSFQVLRDQQAKINQLVMQLANQEKQIANVTNRQATTRAHTESLAAASDASQTMQKKTTKYVYIRNDDARAEVQRLARKLTYMFFFWIRPTDEEIFMLEKDPYYTPESRYDSNESQQQGLLFDLLAGIPEKWHAQMSNQMFTKQVSY